MGIGKLKIKYLFALITLVAPLILFGQYRNQVNQTDSVFEYSYNWNFEGPQLTGIHSYQDSNWTLNGWSGLEFKQYDENFNVVNQTKIADPNYIYLSGWNVAYDGENYYYPGAKRKVANPDTLFTYLIKYDEQGGVLWEKSYFGDSQHSGVFFARYREDSIFLSGFYETAIFNETVTYIMSLDTAGNIGWIKEFPNNGTTPVSLRTTSDKGFIFSVYKQLGFNKPTIVFKLDSLGNTEWQRQLTFPTQDHILSVDEMPDGNFLCYGHSEDAQTTRKRSWLVKLNATGDVLIDTLFNFSAGYDIFGNPNNVLFFDNQIQLTGVIYDDEFSNVAKLHIVRYDFNLNLLWRRVYYHREYQNEVTYQNDMGNGFTLFAGHVSQDPTHPTRDEWFLVLDSLGCDTPNCALGLEALEADQFLIYPNPASTTLNVDFKSYEGQEITVQLVSMEGQLLESYQLLSNLNSIDVRHLSSGIYFVRISREGQMLASEKLVIN